MVRWFLSPSLGFLQFLVLSLCAVTLGLLWGLYFQHKATSQQEALVAKAVEHLNLATIASENLSQLVDRAQAIGRVAQVDQRGQRQGHWSLVQMLADDPVIKRISLYGPNGQQRYSSHSSEPQQLPKPWVEQLNEHIGRYGLKPILPRLLSLAEESAQPDWRLPFLLPLADPMTGLLDGILLVQLDIGYLVGLFQHVDLGSTGLVRLLDDHGNERLRISGSGMVIGGGPLHPSVPDNNELAGRLSQFIGGDKYQSLYRRDEQRGFSVTVSQNEMEILASSRLAYSQQLWLNLSMTVLLLAGLLWIWRVLDKCQEAFCELEKTQQINQNLILHLEEAHKHSSHAAATDHLSGLHNRRQFMEVTAQVLADQRVRRRLTAILFIDMDRFKSINDSLGHKIGDLLLQAVAGRISRALASGDEAARFGGDEFVVVLAGQRSEEQIDTWVRELVQKLSATYSLDDHELNTSPSIGVSICPRDGQEVDDLVRCADAAMYSAKQAGRGQYRFFDPALNILDIEEFALEQAFSSAIKERQFVLHYQPQIRLESMRVVGYEALVRWHHPEFGLLYPDRFISLAERSGFIIALGWEILRLACEELARWQAQGISAWLAVNVSPLQLRQTDFSECVLEELRRHKVPPQRLELDITETAVLGHEGQAIEHLRRLSDAGLSISLDDFGQGYAGFSHLQSLPLNRLKIDRTVIAQLSNSHDDSPIVSSTIILTKRLGLEVVAEGVETREQVVCLRLAGCDIAQGYHFSRPLTAAQLSEYPPFVNSVNITCEQ